VKQVEEVFEIALEGWIRPEKRKKPKTVKVAVPEGAH